MSIFSAGAHAWAICDTCGFRGRYTDMVTEPITRKRVHKRCMDRKVVSKPVLLDAERIALQHPRPDARLSTEAESIGLTFIGATDGVGSFWLDISELFYPDLSVVAYVDGVQSGSAITITPGDAARRRLDFTLSSIPLGERAVTVSVLYNGSVVATGSVTAAVWDGGDGGDTVSGNAADNSITGGGGADSISGSGGNDTLLGEAGNDTLAGDAGADSLDGGSGSDTIGGGNGTDTLIGGAGGDSLSGGSGTDVASYADSDDAVNVDLNAGTGAGGDAQDDSLDGIENLIGSANNDTLTGSTADNSLDAGDGADSLDGGAGNDSLSAGNGDDNIAGGIGNDTLGGLEGNDTLAGDGGSDTISAGNGNDSITGGDGTDAIFNEAGSDTIEGGNGNDTIFDLFAAAGNDSISGGNGNDSIQDGNGDDTIEGGTGSDTIDGGPGADRYVFGDNCGVNRVNDFAAGDVIAIQTNINGTTLASYADLVADGRITGTTSATIDLSATPGAGTHTVFLAGFAPGGLSASNVVFF